VGHVVNVYLNGAFVAESTTPKMTIAMGNSPFDEGVSVVCVSHMYCVCDSFVLRV